MSQDAKLVEQIERVLAKFPAVAASWYTTNMVSAFRDAVAYHALVTESIALINFVYGSGHAQAVLFSTNIRRGTLARLQEAEGVLLGTIESIRHGLLDDIRTQILLDVQGDFLDSSRNALESGAKDVAAALACVVLEDSVKRLAIKSGLENLADKDFNSVVIGLLKADVITKTTKGALLGYTDLRNSALHAQWHEVSADPVRALLHYLPAFIEQHGV